MSWWFSFTERRRDMSMSKLLLVLSCFSVLVAGCASYKPNNVPEAGIDKYKYRDSRQGLTVAVDPYYHPTKTQAVFDNDFREHGLLALNVIAVSSDENKYILKRSEISVSDGKDGARPERVTAPKAGEMVARGYGDAWLWFFATIIGAIPSAAHTSNINDEI
jgi:hypothetical protein